ncbi:MAG: peptidylprolyl isomerase [Dehalococcoidia bacterium]|nr:peptidylprolyl isomerase [Dehalococcoidia bacterium]
MGDFTIALNAAVAPNTVNNFVFLAQKDYFDGITFHRVVDNYIVQAGDPAGTGASTYPGYTTADEPNEVRNTRGTISMAKRSGASNFGSQFFINLKDNTSLDFDNPTSDQFFPFGTVTSGMEVLDAIAKVPVDANRKPTTPVTITDIVIEFSDK